MNSKMILTELANGNVYSEFVYELDDRFTSQMAYQFAEQQKQEISKRFGSQVYLKLGQTLLNTKPTVEVSFNSDFSNVTTQEIKTALENMFPVVLVRN